MTRLTDPRCWLTLMIVGVVTTTASGQCGPQGCPTAPAAPAPVARIPDAVRASLIGVVRIVHRDGKGISLGSGALIADRSDGSYFLTCAHLFDVRGRIEVRIGRRSMPATLVAIDRRNDLALLRGAPSGVRPVEVEQGSPVGVLTACGYGGSGELRCVSGRIVGRSRAVGADAPSLRIAGAVRSGDSGGPVLNASGRLIGVVWGQRSGETYATTDGPLRRILQRLPPRDQRTQAPATPVSDDEAAWRERIERRLEQLTEEPRNRLPKDLVRRGDLQSLSQQWDRQFDRLSSQINIGVAAPQPSPARDLGVLDLLGEAPSLLTAIAVGGPLGVGAWAATRWIARRRMSRQSTSERPIAVDTPPLPQQVVPETHYVSYERDGFAKAHQWASEQLARKFPGSVEMLTSLDSLIKQQLNGDVRR